METQLTKKILLTAFAFALCGLFVLAAPGGSRAEGETLYTAYNIWYEKPETLWCINYKKGNLIPAGTVVSTVGIVETPKGLRLRGASKESIRFSTDDGMEFTVLFNKKYHPGKSVEDYMSIMFTPSDFKKLTAGFSGKEIDAIRDGVIVPGMSKKAVAVSYGVPPEHKTPSMDKNRWTYWTSRFKSKEICFDDSGKAARCEKARSDTL